MLRRKKLVLPVASSDCADGAITKCLSRRLLMIRMQSSDQSSSALTLDMSSASTLRDDSVSSQTHDQHPGRATGSSLKVKTQEESLVDSLRTQTTCRSSSLFTVPDEQAKKTISWSTVEVQTYAIILGDNPATSRGPPLSIGAALDRTVLSLSDYEEHHPPRRTMSDLIVPHATRERLLMDAGYSRSDLHAMEDKLLRIKLARRANATEGVFEKARNRWGRRNMRTFTAT